MKVIRMLKNVFEPIGELVSEFCFGLVYTIKKNVYVFGAMLELSSPYIMWYVAISLYDKRGYFAVGGEIFLPVVIFFLYSLLKKIANRNGKGNQIPVARKRFTKEDDWGEVSIAEEDIQEIILYLNDVENYIERKGLR